MDRPAPRPRRDARRRRRRARPPRRTADASESIRVAHCTSGQHRSSLGGGEPPVALRRAALPDRRRVPRAGARGHRRGAAGRAGGDGRGHPGRAGPPPARLRPRPAPALRGRRADAASAASATAARSARRWPSRSRTPSGSAATSGTRRCRPAPGETKAPLTQVRPGHADLAGMQKYGFTDARDVLERASARETAARVAAGALAKLLLRRARRRGALARHPDGPGACRRAPARRPPTWPMVDESPVRCFDPAAAEAMIVEIKAAAKDGDSLGGVVEVLAYGVPVGLGSHVHWDRKLDAPAGPGGDEHPGRQGRRDRRRLRGRRPAGERGPRRRSAGTPTPATTAATRRSPAASRAACRPASCSSCGRR